MTRTATESPLVAWSTLAATRGVSVGARRYFAFLWARWFWSENECRESRASLAVQFACGSDGARTVRRWEVELVRAGILVRESSSQSRSLRLADLKSIVATVATPPPCGQDQGDQVSPPGGHDIPPGGTTHPPQVGLRNPPENSKNKENKENSSPASSSEPSQTKTSSTGKRTSTRGSRPLAASWQEVLALSEFVSLRASPRFMGAWADWVEYAESGANKDARVPAGPTCKRMLRDALKSGVARYVAAINLSIRNSYRGVNPAWVKEGDQELVDELAADKAETQRREHELAIAQRIESQVLPDIEAGGKRAAAALLEHCQRDGQPPEEIVANLNTFLHEVRTRWSQTTTT